MTVIFRFAFVLVPLLLSHLQAAVAADVQRVRTLASEIEVLYRLELLFPIGEIVVIDEADTVTLRTRTAGHENQFKFRHVILDR
jgi:hypothetical protein